MASEPLRVPALVTFSNDTDHWSRPFLAKGYRHVGVFLADGVANDTGTPIRWVRLEADAGGHVQASVVMSRRLPAVLKRAGLRVLEVTACPDGGRGWWPFGVPTCVGLVKRALGLRAPCVLTPLQLYRALCPEHRKARAHG